MHIIQYFYDNCFSMMFLSDFWLQPWMNRWFAENEELPTQACMISVQLIFYFYASWANRVSKNSFRRLLYIVGAHFIHYWNTILYIIGAHLYLMLEHISIQSRYFTTHNCHMATTHNLINRTSGSMQDLVCFTAPRHGSAPKNSCLCVARILSYCYHCFLCDCLFFRASRGHQSRILILFLHFFCPM